jgi:DNA-binding response OmpR family regulator
MRGTTMPVSSFATAKCILVVEDDSVIGLAVADLLSDEGFRVVGPVATRNDALAALDSDRPDAVLLDLMLRDGHGAELAYELRARRIPFVVFSGHTQASLNLPELQDAPWVEKPARAHDLVAALAAALKSIEPACQPSTPRPDLARL